MKHWKISNPLFLSACADESVTLQKKILHKSLNELCLFLNGGDYYNIINKTDVL